MEQIIEVRKIQLENSVWVSHQKAVEPLGFWGHFRESFGVFVFCALSPD